MTKETSLSIKSLSPLIFSIFCTTTGGPPTTVVWDRSSMHGQPIQTETVTSFEDSTYLIEFIVSQGIIAGDYKVAISNAISYVSSSFNASGNHVQEFASRVGGVICTVYWLSERSERSHTQLI